MIESHGVNRDLKPENLLCKRDSADTTVKLADFGLSKFIKHGIDLLLMLLMLLIMLLVVDDDDVVDDGDGDDDVVVDLLLLLLVDQTK